MRHKNVKAVGDFINTRKVKLKTFLDCGTTQKFLFNLTFIFYCDIKNKNN